MISSRRDVTRICNTAAQSLSVFNASVAASRIQHQLRRVSLDRSRTSTMKYVNYASYLPAPEAPLEVATAPFPSADSLGDDEIIIKNKAVAVK